jgi:quinolinate synthase
VLWQPSLPDAYHAMSDAELTERIAARRQRLGDRLVILGHHYQTDEVIRHADFTGDSLKLSQLAASVVAQRAANGQKVEHIIFCGVHFMAETADMLTPDSVEVILPDLSAGCSMADMASYEDTVEAWDVIHATLRQSGWNGRVIPITYVNSSAAIKAFVGAHGGACCTSSNADQVFDWAMNGGTEPKQPGEDIKILFLPDQHLGRNTSARYGIDTDTRTCVYDPRRARRGEPLGGASVQQLHDSVTILWAGHCSVHKLFRPEHCDEIRASEKHLPPSEKTTILVHPECCKEVVDKSDLSGSTEFIIKTLRDAEPGTKWAVGTEVHLVARMVKECAQRGVHARILSDCHCLCTTMSRIDQPHLLWVLDGLCGVGTTKDAPIDHEGGPAKARNVIRVHPEVRQPALLALDRMLAHTAASTMKD